MHFAIHLCAFESEPQLNIAAQRCVLKLARTYTKGKRATQEAETRQRIVEAALALHGEVGPTATTISMIAERAGVQRHTVYAHLPDDRAVFLACSGLFEERNPLPTPELWARIDGLEPRLHTALTALYAWFDRNEAIAAHVLRDAELNATLREVSDLRIGAPLGAIFASLATGLPEAQQAALAVGLSFYTWRTLVRQAGLPTAAAAALMVRTVLGASG